MKYKICLIVLSVLFAFSGCQSKPVEEKTEDTLPIVKTIEPIEEPKEPTGPKSLLTNEITKTDLSNRRPLGVMIENTKVALPHYGLCDAGIVYEAPAEGGITRYFALYDDYDNYERLGNVRSARPYYIYFAAEYDAIYAHVGQSKDGERVLNTKIVDELNGLYAGNAFFRSNDKKMPHNAYLYTEGILKDLESKNISREYDSPYDGHFTFAEEENILAEGSDCNKISLYYTNNKPYFLYDATTGLYSRYAFGELEPDAYSETGLTFKNIILQNASSRVVGAEGQLDINIIGSGTGKFFTKGKMIDITWEKTSEKARTVYYMPGGSEIELNSGKTYIGIIENSGKDNNIYE